MGMFDSIYVKCPNCGCELECQSKSGDCDLKAMTLQEAVRKNDYALFDINRHAPHICPKCGKEVIIDIHLNADVYVKDEDDNFS